MRFLVHPDLDQRTHRASIDKVRAAIERDDFRSPDVKKLGSGVHHRAKLDYANRLLLHFVKTKDETVCLALEVIENHAYDRSRFLRGAIVDESIVDALPPVDRPEATSVRYIHPSRAEFHFLDRPLSFDDVQDALYRLQPPVLVVGAAGGGKTALTLAKIRKEAGSVLYVTQSRFLAEAARSIYFSHAYENDAQEIDFLSFDDLLASIAVPAGRAVSFREFAAWFARHRALHRNVGAHALFEEFRGVLTARPEGTLSLDEYLALGVRQSIFAPGEREAIFDLFRKYSAWLAETKQYEPNLVAHAYLSRATPKYDLAVVDEAQDLTAVQLALVLCVLRRRDAFIICGDANQIVHPNFFSWSRIKTLLWRDPEIAARQTIQVLALNYRNARTVTLASNAILKIKHARFGSIDKESNLLAEAASDEEGSVVVLPRTPEVLADLDQKTRLSTKMAVLVLRDEDKAEAAKHFKTPLLFSIREAKGLEYENIIVFGMVSSEAEVFCEIAGGVTPADLEAAELAFRRAKDKGDKSLEAYKFFVNALYVAITRAVRNAYLVESRTDHPILGLLGAAHAMDAARIHAEKSSIEDWQREASKLEAQGKAEQAEAIRERILKTDKVPWDVFDASHWRGAAQKALAPNSVHAKAKQQMLEVAAFHGVKPVVSRLLKAIAAARSMQDIIASAWKKFVQPFEGKNPQGVLWQTDRYGVDFRNALNLTPLMLASLAGNVALVEALLDRGACVDASDTFGRTAAIWSIVRAYANPAYAKGAFGAVYDRVAPQSIDLSVDGRLVKLGREQGEYLLFLAMIADLPNQYHHQMRVGGVTARSLARPPFDAFPALVVSERRRRRVYLSSVLARSEASSAYPSTRKLWVREQHGHYIPNPGVQVRSAAGDWSPLYDHLGVDLLEDHLEWKTGSLRSA